MKKAFVLLLLLFAFHSSFAKKKFGIDFSVGVKGGLNFNKIQGKGWKETYNTDPHLGFFMYLNKRHAGFQIEALWTQSHSIVDSSFRGLYSQYMQDVNDSLKGGSFRFNNISLPILLNIKLTQWFWLQVGPQFDANISVTDKNKILKSGTNIINQQNYSAVGGVWLQLGGNAPVVRINLGARYIAALNNINGLERSQVWKNQMIQLHLGLSY